MSSRTSRAAHSVLVLTLLVTGGRRCSAESSRERGAALFEQKGCVQCHAIAGSGGHKGPDLSGVGKQRKKDYIEHQILEGGLAMPSFKDALTPEEAHDLVEFLHRCRKPLKVDPGAAPPPATP